MAPRPAPETPGLGVDDDVGDDPGARQRREPEDRRRGVAARVGDQRGAGDLVAVVLGQPVDRLADQPRLGMRAIPLLVDGGVAQAEVGAEIDHLDPPAAQLGHQLGGGAVGVGDDRGIDVGVPIEVQLLEHHRNAMVGIQLVDATADVGARRDRRQHERRMAVQQPGAQGAGIPGGAEHGDARSHGPSPEAGRSAPMRSCAAGWPPPRR